MLRWFYIGLGCLLVASVIYVESVGRTGREPADLAGGSPEISLPRLTLPGSAVEPVQVFHLSDGTRVALVRDAVDASRIVADIGDGFALREGRIVATGHDATAELLMATGWSDRPLEIHRAEPRLPDYRTRGSSNPGQGRTPRGPNALAHKSHLSQQEAMAVINSLD